MFSAKDSRIYVHQEDMWDVKGRFSKALQDTTPVSWDMTSDGKYTLSLLAVSHHTLFIYYLYLFFKTHFRMVLNWLIILMWLHLLSHLALSLHSLNFKSSFETHWMSPVTFWPKTIMGLTFTWPILNILQFKMQSSSCPN